MFNDKRLGENWFRNTPAQKLLKQKYQIQVIVMIFGIMFMEQFMI